LKPITNANGLDLLATDPVSKPGALPLTVTRPDLMPDGTDRDFRRFVHRLLAFSARLEAIRSSFGSRIGLTGIQYSALISIAHLGRDGTVGVKDVAEHLSLSGSFATLVIGQLVGLDLIDKQTNPDDRRRVCLTVTNKGLDLLNQLASVQREVNDILFGPLDGAQFAGLNTAFGELVRSADAAVGLVQYLNGADVAIAENVPHD
jgi:DNA-binding MarR family transcriptional regulator